MTPVVMEREVTLPVGRVDGAGKVHKSAVIRKMTGHDEALLYDPELSGAALVTELLKGCLIRLGGASPVTSEMVSGLYSADRAYLLVEIRRFSLGDRVDMTASCPGCKAEMDLTWDLGALAVKRLEGDRVPASVPVELDDGYVDRDGSRHSSLWLRLPRGADEEAASPVAERGDALRARDILTLRCIESFGSLPRAAIEGYGIKIVRDLTIGDRRRIFGALEGAAPGVSLTRKITCPRCERAFSASLTASHFFGDG